MARDDSLHDIFRWFCISYMALIDKIHHLNVRFSG